MTIDQTTPQLTDYALELVGFKSRQLVGRAGYTRSDLEDIRQDLILDLLERLPKFDPAKASLNTFVDRVVERKICNLLRYRSSQCRDYRREGCSLDDRVQVAPGVSLPRSSAISQDDVELAFGRHREPAHLRQQRHLDVQMALVDLPAPLRHIAELLGQFGVSGAARRLGVPRTTFRDKHLAQLREAFVAKGMDVYAT